MNWILQGNPARFDVRTYVSQPNIYWLVNRYHNEMQLADHVFIWESGPKGGVVAYGYITELPVTRAQVAHPEYLADALWHDGIPDPQSYVVGVRLRASVHTGVFLPRDVVRSHVDLATLDLFKMPQATVFRCTPVQVVWLLEMC
jgi:hypothetical protein